MNTEQFEALVIRTEQYAEAHPKLYKAKLAGLAVLGYAYIVTVALLSVGVLGALIWFAAVVHNALVWKLLIKGGFLLIFVILVVLKALWKTLFLKIDPPSGHEIRKEDYPELFQMLEELTAKLKAPRIDHVVVTEDFNAAVTQIPRNGLLGGFKNYLILGMPLMMGLTKEQFVAVIGHELGHLSGNHSRFASWIYSVDHTWDIVGGELMSQGDVVFGKFYKWFIPYFDAFSFTLRRRHEYQADAAAAEIVGPVPMGSALINIAIKASFLDERFWKWVQDFAKTRKDPPEGIFDAMSFLLKKGITAVDAKKYLEDNLTVKTLYHNSHPCLTDRLKALQVAADSIAWNEPLAQSAADVYFSGSHKMSLKATLNREWHDRIVAVWQEKHDEHQELERKMRELSEKLKSEDLTADELFEYATLQSRMTKPEDALPLLDKALQKDPAHASASFMKGWILLEQDNADGIKLIEQVMQKDRTYIPSGCDEILKYCYRHGMVEERKPWLKMYEDYQGMLYNAMAEAQKFTPKDQLVPHDLKPEEVEAIVRQLAEMPDVKKVYLAKKVLTTMPEMPVYVFGVYRQSKLIENRDKNENKLLEKLTHMSSAPEGSYFLLYHDSFKKIFKKMSELDNASIYPAGSVVNPKKASAFSVLKDKLKRSA